MRIFVSSLISGMETIRAAAREVINTLRHEPLMAEDFGAQPRSPQAACLNGIRQSDLVVLILGEHYGVVQASGLSATHEEYREAKQRKPVISFVQDGVVHEPKQSEFVHEVQIWDGGLFRGGFSDSGSFRVALTRALYDYDLANAVGPLNEGELVSRALELLTPDGRGFSSGKPHVAIAIAGGPRQSILRPVEIEKPELADTLHQKALFGQRRIFDPTLGTERKIEADSLIIAQQDESSTIRITEQGSILIKIPLRSDGQRMPELIEEIVLERIGDAIEYAAWALDHVDPTQRLTHVAIAGSIFNADYMNWRTQRESDASPNRLTVGGFGNGEHSPVHVSRTRAALRLDAIRIVEDLLVPLRRQWK